MAADDPFQSKPAAFHTSVRLNGFEKIARTGRLETAAAARAGNEMQRGRDAKLVKTDQWTDHSGTIRIEVRRANCNHSHRSDWNEALTAFFRPITTSHNPACKSGRAIRTISRNRRLTRFRTTAPPRRREVTNPILVSLDDGFFSTPSAMNLPWHDSPSRLTLSNSAALVSLADFWNRNCMSRISDFKIARKRGTQSKIENSSRLRVAGKMHFDADRQKPFASALAAAGKDRATAFGFHPGAKSELLFPRALRCLISAFHKKSSNQSVQK